MTDNISIIPTRPALRYFGGKWVLGKWINSIFPSHNVYVEPYGGAASVLLQKKRSYAEVYNDLDSDIVGLFRVFQNDQQFARLYQVLGVTPFSRQEYDLAYEDTDDPVEKARRLIIRSFQGFGSNALWEKSGFRCNSDRSGTTPAHDWVNYLEAMESLKERFKGVVLENRPALQVMEVHDCDRTLHYVDPPYVYDSRKKKRKMYAHEMNEADHEELLTFIKRVEGMVVLSGYHSDLYDDHLSGWRQYERKARDGVANERTEVLWVNNRAAEQHDSEWWG